MHEVLFAYIENKDLAHTDPIALATALSPLSPGALRDMAQEMENLIPLEERSESVPFHFFSNTAYAGFPHPCRAPKCRSDRLQDLAYFATLYAERVTFPSLFSTIHGAPEELLIPELAFYISNLVALRPLFDAGVLQLAGAQSGTICHDCYARLVGYPKSVFKAKLAKLEKAIYAKYVDDVTYFLERWSDRPFIVPRGPTSLVDSHPMGFLIGNESPKKMQGLAKARKERQLTRKQAIESKIPKRMTGYVVRDILNQNYYSTITGTGYLTDRGVDLDVINALAPRPVQLTNALLKANFSHELPVLSGMPVNKLLRVRQDEGAAFQVYRDTLTKAINQARADDPKKIKQVFSDVVKPELHKIDLAMKSARKILVRDAIVDGAVAAGFVTVGLFSGILPLNIGAVIAGLGGYHFADRLGKKIGTLGLEPAEVRSNNYYFLWKVTRH
jgi:hypothetical protein